MGEDANGNFILAPEVCSDTFADALARLGVADVDADITPASVPRDVLLLLNILAVHYENANYGGSSFIVWGTTCTVGGLNLGSQWNDRISSTAHGVCNQVRHYEHKDYQGAVFTTWGDGGNITGVMNDKTSSITYPS